MIKQASEETDRDSFEIVTFANLSKGYYPLLLQQITQSGCPFNNIGLGLKWEGYGARLNSYIQYMNKQPKDKLLVFVDGFDVIALGNLKKIPQMFKESGKQIIIGVEKHNWYSSLYYSYVLYDKPSNNIFPNAGCYMGTSAKLSQMFNRLKQYNAVKRFSDDQLLILNFFNDNSKWVQENVAFDVDRKFFYNLNTFPGVQFSLFGGIEAARPQDLHKRVQNSMFVHAYGNGNLNPLLEYLKYDTKGVGPLQNNQYLWRSVKNFKWGLTRLALLALVLFYALYLLCI